MSRAPTVVCIGLSALDIVQRVPRVPGPDEKLTADDQTVTVGGPATNAAGSVTALGGTARLVTAVGRSPIGDLIRDGLQRRRIELIDLREDGAWTPPVSSVLVTTDTGSRAVVSTNTAGQHIGDELPDGVLEGAAALLTDGHLMEPSIAVARAARREGIPVILDGGSWKPRTDELLEFVDYVICSSAFSLPDGDRSLSKILSAHGKLAARTNGAQPIEFVSASGSTDRLEVPSVSHDQIVDTLGAGDVLHGVFALSVALRGETVGPIEHLRAASMAATESCRFRGALGWADSPPVLARISSMLAMV